MKIISYDPKNIENISKFFNETIDNYRHESDYNGFIMFIFEDILNHAINKENLINSYKNLLINFDLPFAFYPYNLHFNKVLPSSNSIPTPKIHGKYKDLDFDVVNQPCFGMLVLNLNKLCNFKFNEEYEVSFYIQDLIFYCKTNNLYLSNSFFIDVHDSFKLFNSNFKTGFLPNVEKFKKEKEMFFSKNKNEPENINNFVKFLKEKLNPVDNILNQLSDHLKETQ